MLQRSAGETERETFVTCPAGCVEENFVSALGGAEDLRTLASTHHWSVRSIMEKKPQGFWCWVSSYYDSVLSAGAISRIPVVMEKKIMSSARTRIVIVVRSAGAIGADVTTVVGMMPKTTVGCTEMAHSFLSSAPRWFVVPSFRVHVFGSVDAGADTVTYAVALGVALDAFVRVATGKRRV